MAEEQDPVSDQTRLNHSSTEKKDSDQSKPHQLFGEFTEHNLMKRLDEESMDYKNVSRVFLLGMGPASGATHLAAVHEANASSPTRSNRVAMVQDSVKKVSQSCDGKPNVCLAWYGGTRSEIVKIMRDEFTVSNLDQYGRVRLAPLKVSLEAALCSVTDEQGLRHILLCKIIRGNVEVVVDGANHVGNGSHSGVDDVENPRRFYVWSEVMNSHILPNIVVSFTAPEELADYVLVQTLASGNAIPPRNYSQGGNVRGILKLVLANLGRLIPPREMILVKKIVRQCKVLDILDPDDPGARQELYRKVKVVAGENLEQAIASAEFQLGMGAQGSDNSTGGESSNAAQGSAGVESSNAAQGGAITGSESSDGSGTITGGQSTNAAQDSGVITGGESSNATQGRGAVDLMEPDVYGIVENFISVLAGLITPEKAATITLIHQDFRANKITFDDMYHRVVSIVGDHELVNQVWTACRDK